MPKLTVWYVKASLVYLVLGATFGALILSHKGIPWAPWAWRLFSSHMDVTLLGWVTLLIMGIAYWILPRFGVRRGRERWAWAAFLLMNGGLVLAIAAPWLPHTRVLFLLARLGEAASVGAFVFHAWPRVKPLMVSTETSTLSGGQKKMGRNR